MIDEFLNGLHPGDDADIYSMPDVDLHDGTDEILSNSIGGFECVSIQMSNSIEQINDLSSCGLGNHNLLDSDIDSAYFLGDSLHESFSETDNDFANIVENNNGIIEPSCNYEELNNSENIEPESEYVKFKQEEFEMSPAKTIGISNISFGNLYDDRAAYFLNECDKLGIELPSSVTHGESYIDRSCNGGLLEIDKALTRNTLKDALDDGEISQDQFDKLNNKLSSC